MGDNVFKVLPYSLKVLVELRIKVQSMRNKLILITFQSALSRFVFSKKCSRARSIGLVLISRKLNLQSIISW